MPNGDCVRTRVATEVFGSAVGADRLAKAQAGQAPLDLVLVSDPALSDQEDALRQVEALAL